MENIINRRQKDEELFFLHWLNPNQHFGREGTSFGTVAVVMFFLCSCPKMQIRDTALIGKEKQPSPVRKTLGLCVIHLSLGARRSPSRKMRNRVLCLIHFLDQCWHCFKPLRQPNWLLLRLHAPGSALAVSGGATWSKNSLGRVPKKNPNVTTFGVFFLKPLRNPCFGYLVSKWGPEKYPKLTFLGHSDLAKVQ